jgi:hypothetical protein
MNETERAYQIASHLVKQADFKNRRGRAILVGADFDRVLKILEEMGWKAEK